MLKSKLFAVNEVLGVSPVKARLVTVGGVKAAVSVAAGVSVEEVSSVLNGMPVKTSTVGSAFCFLTISHSLVALTICSVRAEV